MTWTRYQDEAEVRRCGGGMGTSGRTAAAWERDRDGRADGGGVAGWGRADGGGVHRIGIVAAGLGYPSPFMRREGRVDYSVAWFR